MRAFAGRMRGVIGARLRLCHARLEAGYAQPLELRPALDRLESGLDEVKATLGALQASQARHERLSRVHHDELGRLRGHLTALRTSDAYAATFQNRAALVSIPIATYNAAELLVERAIASVLAQSYPTWEIVVVGDGCSDDTEARIRALGDARIRFVNLPFRTLSGDNPDERWLVSGAAPQNLAVELSRGEWLAPLDDDDEFLPDHIEVLLGLALANGAELAYGKLVSADGREWFAAPPAFEQIGMQSVLYLRALGTFFEWDTRSWAIEEPADWNLIRRMREAGVRMAATDVPVTRYYPSERTRV